MGKAAKEHRKKVAKRNASKKQQEKKMQKLWQEAFEEQMKTMREKFESMSGNTELSGLTDLKLSEEDLKEIGLDEEDFLPNMDKLDEILETEKQEITKKFKEEFKNDLDLEQLKNLFNESKKTELENTFDLLKKEISEDEFEEVKDKIDEILNSFSNEINEDTVQEKTVQEGSEPTEPIQGE